MQVSAWFVWSAVWGTQACYVCSSSHNAKMTALLVVKIATDKGGELECDRRTYGVRRVMSTINAGSLVRRLHHGCSRSLLNGGCGFDSRSIGLTREGKVVTALSAYQ